MKSVTSKVVFSIAAISLCISAHAVTTIRIGGTGTPGGPDTQAVETFKKAIEAQTGGEVKVQIFPGSQLGSVDEMLEQVRGGTLQCMYESLGDLGSYSPAANIEGVAYLYRDEDQFFRVWRGPAGKEILDTVAQQSGIRLVGPAFRGFREFLTKRPIDKLADLQGMKIRAPGIPAYIESIRSLGASPTSLPYESTYSALQQGVVNGMEQTLIGIKDQRFYEVAKNLAMTNHIAETMGFMCGDKWYQGLNPKTRDAFDTAATSSADWYRKYTDTSTRTLVQQLKDAGVRVTTPNLDEFSKRAAQNAHYDPKLQPYVDAIRSVK
jgi:tripartite ATP-independent transporter DctP family solute receptor